MHLITAISVQGFIVGLAIAQPDPNSGCPPVARQQPSLVRPKDCPDPKTVPKSFGTVRDNECLIAGIVGGDFFNACYSPDMTKGLGGISVGAGKAVQDWSGGSGPYKAHYFTDPSLPNHTIYAPKTPVTGRKMPLIAWANGGCGTDGASFSNFLTEIASHGYMLIASGAPSGPWGSPKRGFPSLNEHSRASQLTQAIDWAEKGAAGGKYGQLDNTKVGVAGQSCGGVEAYSASVLDPRVKATGIYNTGVIDPGRRHYLGQMKQNVGLFYGGKADFAHDFIEQDFVDLPKDLPVIKLSLDGAGHGGTYNQLSGGKFGRASVYFWKWQLEGDQESKNKFFNKSSEIFADRWDIDISHWKDAK